MQHCIYMNTNLNNIFITILTRPINSVHVLNDFHLCGYSEKKQRFQWSYMGFLVSMAMEKYFFIK